MDNVDKNKIFRAGFPVSDRIPATWTSYWTACTLISSFVKTGIIKIVLIPSANCKIQMKEREMILCLASGKDYAKRPLS